MYIPSNNQLADITNHPTYNNSYNNNIMNRLGAVGEYFAFESFLEWFYATVTGDSYSQAISKIVERTNYNKGAKCFPVILSKSCFDNAEVKTIINTYGNLVTETGMPEYDRKNNPNAITYIEELVTEVSGKPIMDVKIVLSSLYNGTQDGTINFYGILKPRTYAMYSKYIAKSESNKSTLEKYWDNIPNISTISYLVVGAVLLGGGLYIYIWLPKNK